VSISTGSCDPEAHRGRHVLLFGEGFLEVFPVSAPPELLTHSWPGNLPRSLWPGIVAQSETLSLRALAHRHGVSHEAIRRTLKHVEALNL
jgi:hypothetical protein